MDDYEGPVYLGGNLLQNPYTLEGFAGSDLPINKTSPALAASFIIKPTMGVLYGLTVTNTKAAAQFVLIFDSETVPGNGAVPLIAKSMAASDAVGFSWFPGRTFTAGIVVCNSSSQATLTLGSADCLFDAQYI